MNFTPIDMESYPRKQHYYYYLNKNNITYSLTAQLNVCEFVKKLKERGKKFYLSTICLVTQAANSLPEFRMGIGENDEPGYYDYVDPSYLIFHKENSTFSFCTSEYSENFEEMYARLNEDAQKFANDYRLFTKHVPVNHIDLSCLPWIQYTEMNVNAPANVKNFYPFVAWGSYGNNFLLPVSVQVSHAAADGYHVGMFFQKLRRLIDEF